MSEPPTFLEGRCDCGATSFRLKAEPLFVHACHCLKCQKNSSSAFGITTIVLEQDVEILAGSLVAEPMPDAEHRFRHGCFNCHSLIYTSATNHPNTALLRIGSLDDPRNLKIGAHIFTKRKCDWLTLPSNVQIFDEGYDKETSWAKVSLERLKEAKREFA